MSEDGRQAMLPGGKLLKLPAPGCLRYKGKGVILGLRPEHFILSDDNGAALELTVNHLETLGADTLIHGLLNGESEMLTIRLAGIKYFEKNQTIKLKFPAENMHIFDPANKRRIVE